MHGLQGGDSVSGKRESWHRLRVQRFICQITQWCKGNEMFCPLSLQCSMWENMSDTLCPKNKS